MNLPEYGYTVGASGQIVKIYRGESCAFGVKTREGVDALNNAIGVSLQQVAALRGGLYHGWQTPFAVPDNYSPDGVFVRGDLLGNE